METKIDADKLELKPYVDDINIPLQDKEWDQWAYSWRKTLVITLLDK